MDAGQRDEAGEGTQGSGLAGAVRAEERDHVTGCRRERHVEPEGAALDDEPGIEPLSHQGGGVQGVGHEAVIQRSRRPARTAIDTASRTRLRAMAASGSFWRAR
jgi:hypothetical protein